MFPSKFETTVQMKSWVAKQKNNTVHAYDNMVIVNVPMYLRYLFSPDFELCTTVLPLRFFQRLNVNF